MEFNWPLLSCEKFNLLNLGSHKIRLHFDNLLAKLKFLRAILNKTHLKFNQLYLCFNSLKMNSSPSQQCPMCFSEEFQANFLTLNLCRHSFCKDCFTQYINTQLNDFSHILKIKCPEQTCSEVLTTETLQETLDAKTFQKYKALLVKKLSHQSQSANICPQPGCSRIFTPIEDASYTNCQCGAAICNACGGLSHEGKSCVAALDPEFEIYAAENDLKFCLMCKTVVVRVEGCTHITCPVCDYEWCWLCGREHKDDHALNCPRKWAPLPPAIIMKENCHVKDTRPRFQRFVTWFKSFIKLMFYIELFWPYLLFNVPAEFRSNHNSWDYKIKLFIVAFIIHTFYMSLMGALVSLMISNPESIPLMIFCIGIVGTTPWLLKLFFMIFNGDDEGGSEERKKRWQSRNAQEFCYTSSHKPRELEQTVENFTDMALNKSVFVDDIEAEMVRDDASNIFNIQIYPTP